MSLHKCHYRYHKYNRQNYNFFFYSYQVKNILIELLFFYFYHKFLQEIIISIFGHQNHR
nr:MAG TPA: hypothetical protein [Caudoviricetes sp.]